MNNNLRPSRFILYFSFRFFTKNIKNEISETVPKAVLKIVKTSLPS